MQFYELTEFLRLSAVLNYQLSSRQVRWDNILTIILGRRRLPEDEREVLIKTVDYLGNVYGQRKRRLGSLAILHPLRATALLANVSTDLTLIDIMTELLHDNFEDIKPKRIPLKRWIRESEFDTFLKNTNHVDQKLFLHRLEWLTKGDTESYYQYIGRLLQQAKDSPEVIRVKLADRLDNTLDMRIDLEDILETTDFFETIFQVLFTNSYRGYKPEIPHPPTTVINGAQRLYQLFKNTVLMSLIRQRDAIHGDKPASKIFNYLARASMKEAQRNVLHIFGYHMPSTAVDHFRELLIDAMEYAQKGGVSAVTAPDEAKALDGLFIERFDHPIKAVRRKKLEELYKDKSLMIEASIAFIVIFLSFMNDPKFYIKGISAEGVRPQKVD
ncbi:MAG: hypothetical protein V2J62_09675 [candidate division KSB1 bacterium]|jgi:hypothetical protein|nr:hypothetical protein [candidate division KSB1 bacterium]